MTMNVATSVLGRVCGASSSRTASVSVRGFGTSCARWNAQSNSSSSSGSGTGSALDELSSSIEQLARNRATAAAAHPSASGAVHNPRSATPTRDRQTVSGRAFMNGHYYNPATLSYGSITDRPARLARPLLGPTKNEAIQHDLIHRNALRPGKPSLHDDSYKNAAILANYVSEMGKILPRASTALTRSSQRQIGKAIRRARSIGLLPVMSRGGTRASGAGWK